MSATGAVHRTLIFPRHRRPCAGGALIDHTNPISVGFYYANGAEHDIAGVSYPEAISGNEVVGADNVLLATGGNGPQAAIYTLGNSSATYLAPGYWSVAYGVSNSGTIIGGSQETQGVDRAFIYNNGVMTDLNTLISGPNPFSQLTVAMGISPSGEYIVGDETVARGPLAGDTNGFLLTPALPGDAVGDGTVDINDLTIVLAHYGQTGQTWSDGEFTGDGTVDINDLTIALAHYGESDASSATGNALAVPEPAGLVLLACCGLALLAAALRRRK
jgi:probable HAF family extracellular repeat protein